MFVIMLNGVIFNGFWEMSLDVKILFMNLGLQEIFNIIIKFMNEEFVLAVDIIWCFKYICVLKKVEGFVFVVIE